jgi:hypothetical protein
MNKTKKRGVNERFRKWVRAKGCLLNLSTCFGITHFAHVKHAGMGGPANKDVGNGVHLCAKHHAEQHSIGTFSFTRKHRATLRSMTLKEHATRLAFEYRLEQVGF